MCTLKLGLLITLHHSYIPALFWQAKVVSFPAAFQHRRNRVCVATKSHHLKPLGTLEVDLVFFVFS